MGWASMLDFSVFLCPPIIIFLLFILSLASIILLSISMYSPSYECESPSKKPSTLIVDEFLSTRGVF